MTLSPNFLRRLHWLNLPGALLVALLQRTPVVRVMASADEMVLASPLGAVLRSAVAAAASLGALHTLAGATEFIINRSNPITGTVGQPLQPAVSFTYNGTPSSPGRFEFTGSLPPGLNFIPAPNGNTIPSGTPVIAGTPTQAGSFSITVQGFNPDGLTNDVQQSIEFEISGGATNSPPAFTTQPANQAAAVGGSAALSVVATGASSFQWQQNGAAVAAATNATLAATNLQPGNTGLYTVLATNSAGTTASRPAILGVTSPLKVAGTGAEVGTDIPHPNTNIFDQVLLRGTAATIRADAGQVMRISYVDLNDDIVQIEFAGAGNVSLVLAGSSGPANPVKYNQDLITAGLLGYMKGHVGIVVAGADETTNLSVFTVGRATAFDPTGGYNILQGPSATNVPANNGSPLFAGQGGTSYDGVADIAFVAISSTNGRFGGLRSSNARYWADVGVTGVFAPGVEFTGPIFVGDITAMGGATPYFQIGSATGDGRTWITGGSLDQGSAVGGNSRAVQVKGITQLFFKEGSTSHGALISAKSNKAVLVDDNGANVTSQIVVNP